MIHLLRLGQLECKAFHLGPTIARFVLLLAKHLLENEPGLRFGPLPDDYFDREFTRLPLGVRIRKEGSDSWELRPLVSVNMTEDYKQSMKILGSILTFWYGHKDSLNSMFSQLPCYTSGSNR